MILLDCFLLEFHLGFLLEFLCRGQPFSLLLLFCYAQQVFFQLQWAFCTNWSHGTKSAILDGKKTWHPPLGHRKQRKVELDRLEFLCVRICYILLPSSMADFVPCDQLVQKAHSSWIFWFCFFLSCCYLFSRFKYFIFHFI